MRRGFTLIEVMIVFFILAIIVGALFTMMSAGRTSWYSADTQIVLQQELRKAMQQITDDLRQTAESQVSVPADGVAYNSVSFNVSNGILGSGLINWSANPINYTLSSGQVIRTQGSDSRILANNITTLSFQRLVSSSNIVRVNLSAQKSTPFNQLLNASLYTAVSLRN